MADAAIVAVLPPLLSQWTLPVNYWFVRRGVASLFVTIVTGVVILAVAQAILSPLLLSLTAGYKRLGFLVGHAAASDKPDAFAKAFETFEKERKPITQRWQALIVAGILANVAMYLSFLYGVWCLFRAAYLS